ncbi:MAG: hypothetical protein C0411_16900 [Pseudomonas sp.]|jgi:hypothetical protein|nr:hypothetical protein [Pseudomonas sp.]
MSQEIGAPEGALRTATIRSRMRYPTDRDIVRLDYNGRLNPTTDEQWQGNDRVRGQTAQAGGFWRSRRQRRKVL